MFTLKMPTFSLTMNIFIWLDNCTIKVYMFNFNMLLTFIKKIWKFILSVGHFRITFAMMLI